ncbi:hypothetical protein HNQ34_001987 [Anoxybacillus tepidamans]|uniref:Uncharacterized protein n=1 Tax=Anoxybacteroides tepidamans TaxID=265948 RepID=A0A7W8IQT1_9BACL|nr:hypothetical protein [Anoxybacillus tepidamans]MBB5324889.1 hypothetical protein [Anoxybacillus tepidamans]
MKITVVKGPLFNQLEKEVYAYLAKVLPDQYQKVKESDNEKAS